MCNKLCYMLATPPPKKSQRPSFPNASLQGKIIKNSEKYFDRLNRCWLLLSGADPGIRQGGGLQDSRKGRSVDIFKLTSKK